ncbi:transcription termination factor NusA [Anaerofustis sp.]|uniref:transcription termination factor NusA n=1 Tax=Anaerofustis sp. TaxID=1872517 RepID=UPI0025C55EDC|nr:transcription termination factor NusA [Anaerofustis sp.]
MARKKKTVVDNSLKDFIEALDEINKSKGIDKEEIIVAVEQALVAAYKKDTRTNVDLVVNINRVSGAIDAFYSKEIVEEVEDEDKEISLHEALVLDKNAILGGNVVTHIDPKGFGRIATQNAKQLIIQKLKESERNIISDTFMKKKDEMVTGVIQREEYKDIKKMIHGEPVIEQNRIIHIDLGKAEGIMNSQNQVKAEHYHPGMRLKVYVSDVIITPRGPQIILSRTHPGLVRRLFEEEVAEIADGIVEIKSISREAGSRSKLAVYTSDEQIDPVGTCIGPKGFRIQNVLNEIGDEKIDVIKWSEDPVEYIKNALAPAEVLKVDILQTEEADGKNVAMVVVDDTQLSLAIGKDGQNVRLAARLTGWKIDIKSKSQFDMSNDADEQLNQDAEIVSSDLIEE